MANEIYQKQGTTLVWQTTGGDEELITEHLPADVVVAGSYYDRGDLASTAAPDEYQWELSISGFEDAPVIGETVDLYFTQANVPIEFDGQISNLSDTTYVSGLDTDLLKNMLYAGSCVVHSTTAGDNLLARGVVRFASRYFAPVVHNNTADVLGASNHRVKLTPVFYQAQS